MDSQPESAGYLASRSEPDFRRWAQNMKRTMLLAVTMALLAGCDEPAARSFLGNVTIGTPAWTNGVCSLPADFPTRMVHSAIWVYRADATVSGTNIYLTAVVTKPPFLAKGGSAGWISLGKIKPGAYQIFYRDPDGATHSLGATTINEPNEASQDTSLRAAPER